MTHSIYRLDGVASQFWQMENTHSDLLNLQRNYSYLRRTRINDSTCRLIPVINTRTLRNTRSTKISGVLSATVVHAKCLDLTNGKRAVRVNTSTLTQL